MKKFLQGFLKDELGQDMVEYVLILAFVAIAAAAIITTTGTDIKTVWTITSNNLKNAATAASS